MRPVSQLLSVPSLTLQYRRPTEGVVPPALPATLRPAGPSRVPAIPAFPADLALAQFGMFLHDPDSNLCWFNPAAVDMEDDFWMVGVIVGLAVYNEATLDVPLPLVRPEIFVVFSRN